MNEMTRMRRVFPRDRSNADSSSFDLVQSWLSRLTYPQAEALAADEMDPLNEGSGHGLPTNWHPPHLPVALVAPKSHRTPQRASHLDRDRPIPISPDEFESDRYPRSLYEDPLERESDKENRKRPRSSTYQDSHHAISEEATYERRPRRKTRSDRYDSKRRNEHGRSTTKVEVNGLRKRARNKQHQLRSSRDVMNNFVSGAIPSTRVTMKPSLTTGLFLNGRSSTPAQGVYSPTLSRYQLSFSYLRVVTDLTFNDMKPMGRTNEQRDDDETERYSASVGSSGQGEVALVESEDHSEHFKGTPSGDSARGITTTTRTEGEELTTDKQDPTSRRQETSPRNPQTDDTHCETYHGSIEDEFLSQQNLSVPTKYTAATHNSETPESILDALIKTGVFDGTGVLVSNLRSTEAQPVPAGLKERTAPHVHAPVCPEYKDKGVMVSPGIDSAQRPYSRNVVNDNLVEDAANYIPQTNVSEPQPQPQPEQHPGEFPLQSCSPGHFKPNLEPESSHPVTLGDWPADNRVNEVAGLIQAKHAGDPLGPHARSSSVSVTSEGGHHYIRCLGLDHDHDLGFSGYYDDLATGHPSLRLCNTQVTEQNVHLPQQDWQLHQELIAPVYHFFDRLKAPSYTGLGPVLALGLQPQSTRSPPTKHLSLHEEIKAYDEDYQEPGRNFGGEDMRQFFQRIEAESMTKWDEAQSSISDTNAGVYESLIKFETTDPLEDIVPVESDNFEYYEAMGPVSEVPQRQPLALGDQDSFVYGNDWSSMTRPRSTWEAVNKDYGAAEPEMTTFWRPNRF
ncbi:hypothetical protein FZEAL_8656 [Fusarium zealandicum]|uniref:Uncharacterized protein n=1 Tax=Fusarium zealandicum TaxID=1053134 RepID=A0A8H4UDF1_9HYPO|nr:hypothetical protein FZEAL_8656 [Fusarium zealandicum]